MPANLNVVLLTHTPEPERAVASAGRLCYSPSTAAELRESMSTEEVEKLVKMLVRSGHTSTLEHASFTFGIDGISRACSHQLVRHRLASYSQQSQRYVRFSDDGGFIIPPKIAEDSEALSVFEDAMTKAQQAYDRLVELGTERGLAKETVQEDARFVLPNAAETRIVVTMNARELRHFFRIRCCRRAQWEINALAWRMRALSIAVAPVLFRRSGPDCLYGKCREGKMHCGEEYTLEEVAGMEEWMESIEW
ncbi:MAG: FAD-dependent thymidylate synthase [Actinobacteria bacterium]|nr:FAD-dependent thymidylate synthase [Actinomycetota bacterium]MCL5882605.1 FAD-dependent thymidylate synthase [Actinomycetota bacterium]